MPNFGHTGRRTAPLVIFAPRTEQGSAARCRSELGMEPGQEPGREPDKEPSQEPGGELPAGGETDWKAMARKWERLAKSNLEKTKVCGVRVEDIEDPTMRTIRQLDKLVDELAKGRPLERVLRG